MAADQGIRPCSYSFASSNPWNTQRNTWKFDLGHFQTKIALGPKLVVCQFVLDESVRKRFRPNPRRRMGSTDTDLPGIAEQTHLWNTARPGPVLRYALRLAAVGDRSIDVMSIFEPLVHVFVDESKSKGYFIAAAAVAPENVTTIDKSLRKLTRRGQSRLHFNSESDSSRRKLLARMAEMEVRVKLYVVRGYSDKDARTMCLQALVSDLAGAGVTRLLIERDDSIMAADRRIIRASLVENNYLDQLQYQHVAPADHSVLWVSDAAAWCHQAGGEWVQRADPIVGEITKLG